MILLLPSYMLAELLVNRILGMPSLLLNPALDSEETGVLAGDIVAGLLLFTVWWAYETLCVVRWGQTPGKMLLSIKVIPVNEDVVPLGVAPSLAARRATLLNFPTAVAWLPAVLVMAANLFVVVAVLWPLWDRPWRQGLHDRFADTRVVHITPPRPSLRLPGTRLE